jgi:hypothetical protein
MVSHLCPPHPSYIHHTRSPNRINWGLRPLEISHAKDRFHNPPLFRKNHKFYILLCSSPGLCTVCIMRASSSLFGTYCCLSASYFIMFLRTLSLSFLVRPLGLDWTSALHQKGICFIARPLLVDWLSSPSYIPRFLGFLFDTTSIPRSSLLSHVGLSLRVPPSILALPPLTLLFETKPGFCLFSYCKNSCSINI